VPFEGEKKIKEKKKGKKRRRGGKKERENELNRTQREESEDLTAQKPTQRDIEVSKFPKLK